MVRCNEYVKRELQVLFDPSTTVPLETYHTNEQVREDYGKYALEKYLSTLKKDVLVLIAKVCILSREE